MPNLYTLSGPDSITVYWDLPAQPAERYDILLDGAHRGSTGKTHFTLRGLASDTSYQIEVRPPGSGAGPDRDGKAPPERHCSAV